MSKQRRNKKTTTPKPKSGRGIRRTSDLPDWSTRPACGALEAFSSPSSSSPLPPLHSDAPPRFQTPLRLETLGSPFTESISQLARSVHDRITTPFNTVDTAHNYSKVNSSTSSPSTENQEEDKEQEAVDFSALSGYSPGGSSHKSHEHNRSVDPDTNEGRYLFGSFTPGDLEEEPEDDPNKEGGSNDNNEDPDLPESTPSPVAPIKAKMTSVNFDSVLEHFVVHFLKVKITHQIAYVLDQAFVNTIDEFRSTNPVDIHTFTYKLPGDAKGTNGTLLHMTLVKQIQSGVYYCRFLEDNNDPACDDPTKMDYANFSKWRRNGQAVYQASLNPPGKAIAPPSIGSTTAAYVSTVQKDDDAALISWNRKPRNVAKYPILKTDAGYPDWRLKMKRQLIADTLQRVTNPTFKTATSCW
jgi:hypothetical protein